MPSSSKKKQKFPEIFVHRHVRPDVESSPARSRYTSFTPSANPHRWTRQTRFVDTPLSPHKRKIPTDDDSDFVDDDLNFYFDIPVMVSEDTDVLDPDYISYVADDELARKDRPSVRSFSCGTWPDLPALCYQGQPNGDVGTGARRLPSRVDPIGGAWRLAPV
jgi:hypothetical protein